MVEGYNSKETTPTLYNLPTLLNMGVDLLRYGLKASNYH